MSDHVDPELSEEGRNSSPPTQVKLVVWEGPAPIGAERYEGQKKYSAQPADTMPQPADKVPWTHEKIRTYLITNPMPQCAQAIGKSTDARSGGKA